MIFHFQDWTVDIYFRQFWQDPRLSFTKRPGMEKIVLGAEISERIWTPDTFFVNAKEVLHHEEPTPNTLLRVLHTGEVLMSKR